MKKFIYIAIASGLALVVCNKESNHVVPENNLSQNKQSGEKMGVLRLETWLTYVGEGKPCKDGEYNCCYLDTLVVKPRFTKMTFDHMSAAAIGAYWSDPSMLQFCNQMPQQIVAKLQSGNYLMKGNFEDAQTMNFIVGTSAPLSPQNFEFALQFQK